MANKNEEANEFERKITRMERGIRISRAHRIKKEGYKSEGEYWRNTNPFENTDPKKGAKHMAIRKKLGK